MVNYEFKPIEDMERDGLCPAQDILHEFCPLQPNQITEYTF